MLVRGRQGFPSVNLRPSQVCTQQSGLTCPRPCGAQLAAEREAPAPPDKLAARRQREAEAAEAERRRKEAAAAKLRALEERIAARAAERCAWFFSARPCARQARA